MAIGLQNVTVTDSDWHLAATGPGEFNVGIRLDAKARIPVGEYVLGAAAPVDAADRGHPLPANDSVALALPAGTKVYVRLRESERLGNTFRVVVTPGQ